jgi:hypothetical protein
MTPLTQRGASARLVPKPATDVIALVVDPLAHFMASKPTSSAIEAFIAGAWARSSERL